MTTVQQKRIDKSDLQKSLSYQEYRSLFTDLVDKGLTSGSNQSDYLTEITKLNWSRSKKWDKIAKPNEALLQKLNSTSKQVWVVLTEAWCGDAAQNLPIIAKLALSSPNIELKIILRDDNLEIMDQFLTNGGRSIPKLIMLDADSYAVLGEWGPRPAPLQEKLRLFKASGKESKEAFNQDIHQWYAKDKGQTLQKELLEIVV